MVFIILIGYYVVFGVVSFHGKLQTVIPTLVGCDFAVALELVFLFFLHSLLSNCFSNTDYNSFFLFILIIIIYVLEWIC